jgi:hypothetical protein
MRGAKTCLYAILCGSACAACNDVVGIDEPIDISGPAVVPDGAPDRALGWTSGTDASASPTPGDSPSSEAAPTSDAAAPGETSPGPDVAGADLGSPDVADSASARPDVADGTTTLGLGVAIGSCSWSDLNGTNADVSTLVSNLGNAKHTLADADEMTEVNLTSFVLGVSRSVRILLPASIVPERTYVLGDTIRIEYYEVATGRRWSSVMAKPRGGSVRIDDMNEASFAFAIINAEMGPDNAQGSFTLNGSGSAHPQ